MLEGAAVSLALPGAADGAVRHREVLDLAVDDVGDGARLVLRVGFEMHDPTFRIERRVLDLMLSVPGIDHAGDGSCRPSSARTRHRRRGLDYRPSADPRSLQRMSFLRHRPAQQCRHAERDRARTNRNARIRCISRFSAPRCGRAASNVSDVIATSRSRGRTRAPHEVGLVYGDRTVCRCPTCDRP